MSLNRIDTYQSKHETISSHLIVHLVFNEGENKPMGGGGGRWDEIKTDEKTRAPGYQPPLGVEIR